MDTIGMTEKGQYLVESILRACDLLQAFRYDGEALPLRELVARSGLNKTTVFRILRSLEKGGLVERTGAYRYRSNIKPLRRHKVRLGYAAQGSQFPFSREVTASIRRAAEREQIDLVEVSNEFSPRIAIRNAEKLVKARVDLAIEHQTFEQAAPLIAAKMREASIPVIAIGFPHPGAVYYGANNYQAGLIAGRALARWAKERWHGQVDEVILLGRPMGGSVPQTRVQGIETGIQEVFGDLRFRVVHLNGEGQFGPALQTVRKHLRYSHPGRTLVGAINDSCALGALRAFEEAGCLENCAVLGQGASSNGRAELRKPKTRLLASVAYFPENYGPEVIGLALDILGKKPVPQAVFIKHQLITPANVDHFYPNDVLLRPEELESALLQQFP